MESLACAAQRGGKCVISKFTNSKKKARAKSQFALALANGSSETEHGLALMDAAQASGPSDVAVAAAVHGPLALLSRKRKQKAGQSGFSPSLELMLQQARELVKQRSRANMEEDAQLANTLSVSPSCLLEQFQRVPFFHGPEPIFQSVKSDLESVDALGFKETAAAFPLVLSPAVPKARLPFAVDLSSACMSSAWAWLHSQAWRSLPSLACQQPVFVCAGFAMIYIHMIHVIGPCGPYEFHSTHDT